jgi:threonine dehydrogenase-like Zn-dependent dehydrogenase
VRQLVYVKRGLLEWREVDEPSLQEPSDALVRPFVAARCDGDVICARTSYPRWFGLGAALHLLDPSLGRPATDPFQGSFAFGHECVAEVLKCGPAVRALAPGQQVIVPWAISCGACARCHVGLTSHCARQSTPTAAFGFGRAFGEHGGFLSDVVRVPHADFMLAPVPAGLNPLAIASASDNLADAYRTVAPGLERWPGAPVLVVGGAARSIGLYAAALALALGSERVDYVDEDPGRLSLAQTLGANPIPLSRDSRWFETGEPVHAGGYPISVHASSDSASLTYAIQALSPGGTCTAVGFYMRKGTPLPLWRMFMNSSTLHVGISHPRRDLAKLLALVSSRAMGLERVVTVDAPWDDAPRAFVEDATKVVVRRPPLGVGIATPPPA